MLKIRLIARLDIKSPNLIKPIRMEGVRVVGDPNLYARRYNEQDIDEILFMDVVASLYGRNALEELVSKTAEHVFVPLTVGGGIRSVEDAKRLFRAGADKIAVNTAAVHRPELINELADKFGSQAVVIQIDYKRHIWEGGGAYSDLVWCDGGRENTGKCVTDWADQAVERGAGEILLTSIDQEGTQKGFDCPVVMQVSKLVTVPVIASGGMGEAKHAVSAFHSGASAIAMAHCLHYDTVPLHETRKFLQEVGFPVRDPEYQRAMPGYIG